MRIADLTKRTQLRIVTCSASDDLKQVAALLAREELGAIPVIDEARKMVGIVSERDICHALASFGHHAHRLTVADVMTANVVVCGPEQTVAEAIAAMSKHQIRHLPLVAGQELLGMIHLRDLLQASVEDARLEINVLRDYARMRG